MITVKASVSSTSRSMSGGSVNSPVGPIMTSISPLRRASISSSSGRSWISTATSGVCRLSRAIASGTMSTQAIGETPMIKEPSRPRFLSSTSSRARERTDSIAAAWLTSRRPRSVSAAPRRWRSSTGAPSARSSTMMLFDSAGCETPNAAAAPVKDPCCAIRSSSSRRLGSRGSIKRYNLYIWQRAICALDIIAVSASTQTKDPFDVRREERMSDRDIYLVGSVPMRNAEQVFETVGARFGSRIKRIPDGETGERSDWITWLEPAFADNPAFQKSGEFFRVHETGTGRERYTLRPGIRPQDVRFDNLFYADIASASYATFKRVKSAGKIAQGTKFQVDLVPAHSVIWLFLVDRLHAQIDPIYNAALKREVDKIAAAIPHHELAIQFDVASAVFARLERQESSSYGRTKAEMQETFSRILIDL